MPIWTVKGIGGVRFEVRLRENGHNIPHIHAHYAGRNVSIALDGSILAGEIAPKKQKAVIEWVKANKEEVETKWKEVHHK